MRKLVLTSAWVMGLTMSSATPLVAQDYIPFVVAGLSGGGDGAWAAGVGLAVQLPSGWEWSSDIMTYTTGPLSGDRTVSIGLEGRTKPIFADRIHFLFGPRVSTDGPDLGFAIGGSGRVFSPRLNLRLEVKAHVANQINQVSVLVRKAWW